MDLTLSDFKEMLKRKKGRIFFFTLLSSLLFFAWAVTRDIRYRPEASFRDKGNASGIKESMSAIIFGGEKEDSEAISALTSFRLTEKLIKKEALQLQIEKEAPLEETVISNLNVEKALFLKQKTPSLPDSKNWIRGVAVDYRGETYLRRNILFQDDNSFLVDGEEEGKLGEVFFGDNYYFVLEKDPDASGDNLTGKSFTLTLQPLKPLAKEIKESLIAKSDTDDSTLIRIAFTHPDRKKSAYLLNSLLSIYRTFLEEEHDRINEAQLDYLQRREEEMAIALEDVIEAHAKSVKGDLSESGFTDSKKEMDYLTSQLVTLNQKLSQLQLDEKRLQKVFKEGTSSFDATSPGASDAPIINELLQKLRELKTLEDSLEIALIEEQLSDSEISSLYLKGFKEYQGVSLLSAKELYLSFAKERQENESAQKQLNFLLKNFEGPSFEITSLTAFLNDPVSHEKIMKASSLSHALKDEENRTAKELDRIREELAVEKAFLKSHLSETLRLTELKRELLLEKTQILQASMLQMAAKESKVVKKQMQDYLQGRLNDLALEKEMLSNRQKELKEALSVIPDKWVREERLNQHLERHKRLTENVVSLVETKNISNNLELVQSAPLDYAWPPIHPNPPRLMLHSFLGAFLGLFFASSFYLTKGILKDTPLTLKNLNLNGFHAKDSIKRGVNSLLPEDKRVALLLGKTPSKGDKTVGLLKSRGERLFTIKIENKASIGLIKDYLAGGSLPEIPSSGLTLPPEVLNHPRFKMMIEELLPRFDRLILASYLPLNDPDQEPLIRLTDGTLIFLSKETTATLGQLLQEVLRYQSNKRISFIF